MNTNQTHSVIDTAFRLTEKYGAKEAARYALDMAFKFSKDRKRWNYWRDVADSILDVEADLVAVERR